MTARCLPLSRILTPSFFRPREDISALLPEALLLAIASTTGELPALYERAEAWRSAILRGFRLSL